MKKINNRYKNIFSIIGIFFISLCNLIAQQPAYFKLGENEFSGVQIYDVIQDNELNYWFATDQGLYKYDSHNFKKVMCDEMKGFSVFGFVKTKRGIIYCHNLNKQIFKIKNDICTVYYELKGDEYSKNISLAISKGNHLVVINGKRDIVRSSLRKNLVFSDGKVRTEKPNELLSLISLVYEQHK